MREGWRNQWGRFCCGCLVAVLNDVLPASAQDDVPSTGDLIQDARIIITSDKGDVRLWSHAPRVVLLYQEPWAIDAVQAVLTEVEDAVHSPFDGPFFGGLTHVKLPQNLGEADTPMVMQVVKGGPTGGHVHIQLSETIDVFADIVVAVADRPAIAVLNGLWAIDPRFTQAQMKGGRARCFYSVTSRKGLRYGAFASIVPHADPGSTADCIREELLHTLGPLTDAEGSRHFTFDNEDIDTDAKRQNDLALIRALYESGVAPGDPPDRALDYLRGLID